MALGGRAASAYVDEQDSRAAGEAAAQGAVDSAGGRADVAFCFHHGRHDGAEVLAGVRSVVGVGVPVVGGTAMGVITNDSLGYEGHQVGVAVAELPGGPPPVGVATGFRSGRELEAGRELGRALAGTASGRDLFFVYSSIERGIAEPEGMALRFGTPLLEGLTGDLADCRSIAGAGLIDSLQPGYSHVFTPDGAERDGIAAVAFGDGAQLDSVVVHGCRPAGAYHEITKTMGPVVAGIDGRPALEVIDELLGGAVPREDFGFRVILGVNRGDPFGAFDEENYQTRLCLAVDEAAGGLVMFEPDLEPGDQVQLMRVSTDLSYVGERVAGLLERVDGRTPLLALYADCAGRCMMASPLDEEEGHAVQAALGDIPLLGFYTGVEIGAVKGRVRPLDWTGVLCLLSV